MDCFLLVENSEIEKAKKAKKAVKKFKSINTIGVIFIEQNYFSKNRYIIIVLLHLRSIFIINPTTINVNLTTGLKLVKKRSVKKYK
jgi:vacuolar-type H+-ATPase subunit F/Vma7